jgi:hypothetical protein
MASFEPNDEISYTRAPSDDNECEPGASTSLTFATRPLANFILLAILFSANHGAMVSCLAFTTLQLGATGAKQLVLLHVIYAASSLLGATFCVKQLGARNSMILGMGLYTAFVGCFWISLLFKGSSLFVNVFAIFGAVVAGTGGALVWTAQGSYFGHAAQDYSFKQNVKSETATSYLAGVFAFVYLSEEVLCKLLSWILLQSRYFQWTTVFGVYTIVAAVSTILMIIVYDYPSIQDDSHCSIGYKMTAAWQLLWHDKKMPLLIGLNAVFGFAYPFVNSYVNGEVEHKVLPRDWNMHDVGLFSALSSAVAAMCCLMFGFVSPSWISKGPILITGSISFAMVAILFIIFPNLEQWGWIMLSGAYCFQGIGRASTEGALRAAFADFFPHEVEGAFANIILQNGIFTSIGFFLSYSVTCSNPGPYCVEFKEGGMHNVLVLEVAVVVSAVVAILGYWKASLLFQQEQIDRSSESEEDGARYLILPDNENGAASDGDCSESR